MEELILSKDIVLLKGAHCLKREKVTAFFRSRGIFPVKKEKDKNLFLKKEIVKSLKDKPYIPKDKDKIKNKSSSINIDKTKYMLSEDVLSVYGNILPTSAKVNFSSYATVKGIRPFKKIQKTNKQKINIYKIEDIKALIKRLRTKKNKRDDGYVDSIRNSDCTFYLEKCLVEAAIKNKKINCKDCIRYQKKDFKYYETT